MSSSWKLILGARAGWCLLFSIVAWPSVEEVRLRNYRVAISRIEFRSCFRCWQVERVDLGVGSTLAVAVHRPHFVSGKGGGVRASKPPPLVQPIALLQSEPCACELQDLTRLLAKSGFTVNVFRILYSMSEEPPNMHWHMFPRNSDARVEMACPKIGVLSLLAEI